MAEEQVADSGQSSGKLPMKSILIVAVILLLEGGLFAVWMMMDEPESAAADTTVLEEQVKTTSSELQILERLQVPNRRTGRLMMYDLEVAVEVDPARITAITEQAKQYELRIKDAVYTIVAQAEPYYFEEPDRQTLKRQIHSSMEELFGEGVVKRVLIPHLIGYRGD